MKRILHIAASALVFATTGCASKDTSARIERIHGNIVLRSNSLMQSKFPHDTTDFDEQLRRELHEQLLLALNELRNEKPKINEIIYFNGFTKSRNSKHVVLRGSLQVAVEKVIWIPILYRYRGSEVVYFGEVDVYIKKETEVTIGRKKIQDGR